MKPWVMEAFKTGLFTPISLERGEFSLKGTEYTVIVRRDAVIWQKKMIQKRTAPTRSIGDTSTPQWDGLSGVIHVNCSFEEVFESVPQHVRKEMIYHLDWLNKGGSLLFNNKRIRGMNTMLIAFDELVHFGD